MTYNTQKTVHKRNVVNPTLKYQILILNLCSMQKYNKYHKILFNKLFNQWSHQFNQI